MKKLVPLLLAAVVLLGFGGCKKVDKEVDKLLTFYVADDYTFTMPAIPVATQVPPLSFPTSTDAAEEFRQANTAAGLVKDVALDKLTLTITNPPGANFDFLDNVRFYISTDPAGSDRVLLASMPSVPLGVRVLDLPPSGEKLDKYLKAQNYILTVEGALRTPVPQPTTLKLDYRFKVTADPL